VGVMAPHTAAALASVFQLLCGIAICVVLTSHMEYGAFLGWEVRLRHRTLFH
jgi:hypothetical protein